MHHSSKISSSLFYALCKKLPIALLALTNFAFAQNQPIPPLPIVTAPVAGSLGGSVEVSELGGLRYSVALAVPPGRNGIEPRLAIRYSDSPADGLLATGWTVSGFSTIHRCPSTIAADGVNDPVDFDNNDKFCLDGERLIAVSGTYGSPNTQYRTERESFSKIVSLGTVGSGPERFTVYYKDGRVAEYGANSNTRLGVSSYGSATAWLLTSVRDRLESQMEYQYQIDTATQEVLPSRIQYLLGGAIPATDQNSVRFIYENRQSPRTSGPAGAFASAAKRIQKIEMYAGSALAWEYRAQYQWSAYARTDRLAQLSVCGSDGVCLPATQFGWESESAPPNGYGSTAMPSLADLGFQQGYSNTYGTSFVGDWDGDGRMDIGRNGTWGIKLYRSNGSAFEHYASGGILAASYYCGDSEVYPGDWNGDGRTDLAWQCSHFVRFLISTPSGFEYSFDYQPLSRQTGRLPYDAYPMVVGDWNNDGRSDIARAMENSVEFFISTGTGLTSFASLSGFGQTQGYPDARTSPMLLGDWNGDGQIDFARRHSNGQVNAAVNTGSGFSSWASVATGPAGNGESSYPIFVGDWNGDGLSDIGKASSNGPWELWRSNGAGFSSLSSGYFQVPGGQARYFVGDFNGDGVSDLGQFAYSGVVFRSYRNGALEEFASNYEIPGIGSWDATAYPYFLGDWNGDGTTDFARSYNYSTEGRIMVPSYPLKLRSVTDGFGAETLIEYRSLTDPIVYTKGSAATYPLVDAQPNTKVVSAVRVRNSLGTLTSTSYRYEGLRYDASGRGILGFAAMVATEESRGITTRTIYRQDFPFIGQAERIETRLPDGTLVQRRTERLVQQALGSGRILVRSDQTVAEEFELNGSLTKRETITLVFDAFGNVTRETKVTLDGHTTTTEHEYTNDEQNWLIGLLTRTTVNARLPGDPIGLTRASDFQYTLTAGTPPAALLTRERVEPDLAEHRTVRTHEYDSAGNRTRTTTMATGSPSEEQEITYDTARRFPISIMNPAGHVVTQQTDPRHGKISSFTDENGLVSQIQYDAFGRKILENSPDGTQLRTLYLQLTGSDAPANAAYLIRTDRTSLPPQFTYHDALGREVRKEMSGFDGTRIFIDRVYNERGETTHISEPYFSNVQPLWEVSEYDLLGRVVRVTEPGQRTTRFEYAGLTTRMFDPQNAVTIVDQNAQGRTSRVTDTLGSSVNYEYDAFGNLVLAIDGAGNETRTIYDVRGNRLELDEPNMGRTTFTYNARGRLTSKTNAKNETELITYDELGRILTVRTPEGDTTYSYDTAAGGIGKLATIVGPNHFRLEQSYDQFGRVTQIRRSVGAEDYELALTYDLLGREATRTYPNGFRVGMHYNAFGFLNRVTRLDTGASVWEATSRNARGQISSDQLGNGLRSSFSYEPGTGSVTRARTLLGTGAAAPVRQDFSYAFDAVGNVISRADLLNNTREDFTYDPLGRLTRSQVQGQTAVDITYNAIGNIMSRSDVGVYTYNNLDGGPHAVTRVQNGSQIWNYEYDNAGNRVTDPWGTMEYRYDGRLETVLRGTNRTEFRYEPDGSNLLRELYRNNVRVERIISIGDLFERRDAGGARTETTFIHSPEGLVALYRTQCSALIGASFCPVSILESETLALAAEPSTESIGSVSQPPTLLKTFSPTLSPVISRVRLKNSATLLYLLKDHLGSTSSVYSETGQLLERQSFDPWGRRRDPITWAPNAGVRGIHTDRGFTGHIQHDSLSIVQMGARAYDPIIGRFLSPDAVVQAPHKTQSLNRYTYAFNNPLTFVDPTGHFGKRFWKRLRQLIRIAVVAAVAIYVGPQMYTLLGGTAGAGAFTLSNAIAMAISGAVTNIATSITSAIMYGQSIGDGLYSGFMGMPMAAAQSAFAWAIGTGFDPKEGALRDYVRYKAIAHGISNGATSAIGGGRFVDGFAMGTLAGLGGQHGDLAGALLGGATASAITGGKFSEGVMRGAYIYLFNDLAHKEDPLSIAASLFGFTEDVSANAILDVKEQYLSWFAQLRKDNILVDVLVDFPSNHPTYMKAVGTTIDAMALLTAVSTGGLTMVIGRAPWALSRVSSFWGGISGAISLAKGESPFCSFFTQGASDGARAGMQAMTGNRRYAGVMKGTVSMFGEVATCTVLGMRQ